MERVTGIEPAQLAWKARTLPLSYTRKIVARSATASPSLTWHAVAGHTLLLRLGEGKITL